MFDGILLINKDKDWTSHDVVAKVRGAITAEKRKMHEGRGFCMEMQHKDAASTTVRCKCRVKVGHTGTLDPLAIGLMILVVGSFCKRAEEFSKLDKVYEVTMKLGLVSTTGDEEGEKTKISPDKPDEPQVIKAIESFVGKIKQTPPAYSAIKVSGKKAYELARSGKQVKLEPRTVHIYQISSISYAYPTVQFTAHVSSGTYVRSLVADIGEQLKVGAYMSDLHRTHVGDFDIADAVSIEELQKKPITEQLVVPS